MADDQPMAPVPAPVETSDRPLMWALDQTGAGPALKKAGIAITGNIEGGLNYDASKPKASEGFDGILFPGLYKNHGELNQIDFNIERDPDHSKPWDVGFVVQFGYGVDDSVIHSSGILDSDNKNKGLKALGGKAPIDQLDLTQAFVTLGINMGANQYMTIMAGKFVTIFGNETINPEGNQFYTHSYNFSYGIPFTSTGIFGIYSPNGSDWTFEGGITRGFNNTLYDNNGAPDVEGQVVWAPSFDQSKWKFTLNGAIGPQNFHDDGDYELLTEILASYKVSDQLSVTGDFLYGDDPHTGKFGPGNGAAQWYGAAFYAGYTINDYVTANGRAEWYDDANNFTVPLSGGPHGTNYSEFTLGVSIMPMPHDKIWQNLVIRPEVREDFGDHGAFGGQDQELTMAVDALFKF